MTNLERIARTMFELEWKRIDRAGYEATNGMKPDFNKPLHRDYWMTVARAAVEAMRYPSEQMLDKMAETNNCYDSGNYAAVWTFGIDAILNEKADG